MADFSNYFNQAQSGGYGGVNVPPAPGAMPGRGAKGGPNIASYLDPLGNAGSFVGLPAPSDIFGGLFGGGGGKKGWNPATAGAANYRQGTALLNAYNWLLPYTAQTTARGASAFGDIYRNEATKSKAYELAQFEDYAPRYAQAILNADPRQAQLLQLYNQQLGSDVNQNQSYVDRLRGGLDNPMSSASIRDIMQASLQGSGARGFGPNARDAAMAYISTGLVGEQLQQQREQIYQQALSGLMGATGSLAGGIQANKSVLGDPFLAFAGRPGQPQGSNPQSPDYSGFNNDLFSFQVNNLMQNRNLSAANAASNKALIGQLVGSVLGAAGGVGKGMI